MKHTYKKGLKLSYIERLRQRKKNVNKQLENSMMIPVAEKINHKT